MQKLKQAIILTTVPSTIQQFNMGNIKLLQELGYKVDVASNFDVTGNIDEQRLKDFKNELKSMDVNFYNIKFSRNPFSKSVIKAYKETKKLFKEHKYDLIHCHTPVCGAITRLAAKEERKNGTRVIYTAHGFHFYKGAPLLNWLIYYPIEKWLSRYTDCLITINQEDYDRAKEKFKKCNEIKLIQGVGIDKSKFDWVMPIEEKERLRKEFGIDKDDYVLVSVGELNKNKNQIMQIEALKEIVKDNKNVKLLIVGKGKLKEFLESKIKEYKLEKNVILTGYRRDIPRILKISNCLVSTSRREGLPVNLIEAMMSRAANHSH